MTQQAMEQVYNDFYDSGGKLSPELLSVTTASSGAGGAGAGAGGGVLNPFDLTDSSARWIGLLRVQFSWYVDDLEPDNALAEDTLALFGHSAAATSTLLNYKITARVVGERREEGSGSVSALHANKGKLIDVEVHVIKAVGLPREYAVNPYVEYHFYGEPHPTTVRAQPNPKLAAAAPDQNPLFHHKRVFRLKIDDAFLQFVDYGGPKAQGGILEFNVWGSPKQKSVKATADSAPNAAAAFDATQIRLQAHWGVRPSSPLPPAATPRASISEPAGGGGGGGGGITIDLTRPSTAAPRLNTSPPSTAPSSSSPLSMTLTVPGFGGAALGPASPASPAAGGGARPSSGRLMALSAAAANFGQRNRLNETDIHADAGTYCALVWVHSRFSPAFVCCVGRGLRCFADEKVARPGSGGTKEALDKEALERMAKEQSRALAELMRIHNVLNPAMSALDVCAVLHSALRCWLAPLTLPPSLCWL